MTKAIKESPRALPGRPPSVPDQLNRMLLVGHCIGNRSERHLFGKVHLKLANCWILRLNLTDLMPYHSVVSESRYGWLRHSELLHHLFETTVACCIEEDLVSVQRMAVDACLIQADATTQHSTPKEVSDAPTVDPADAPRVIREYLYPWTKPVRRPGHNGLPAISR